MVNISYAITAHNEDKELDKLISTLLIYQDVNDEIVVLLDSKYTSEVKSVCDKYKGRIKVYKHELKSDFAEFKNFLFNKCKKDYIFNIDADELPNIRLLKDLHVLLDTNPGIDMLIVPRINMVTGITPEHISKWNWNINTNGYINFPDWQTRIVRNVTSIKWEGKVHERLVGYTNYTHLPIESEWCLLHVKSIAKQESQNSFYESNFSQ